MITRRDFLNGSAIAIGTSLTSPWTEAFGSVASQSASQSGYYPPGLTGLRGSHDGSWETMHARVAGKSWAPGATEAEYDLVIVGAGISGLSAAYHYRKQKPDATILILDNHDDFGGHAKRNEFTVGKHTQITYGGTEAIDSPASYKRVSRQLLKDIGIDLERFYEYFDQEFNERAELGMAVVFDKETYGQHAVAKGYGSLQWSEFVKQTPLSDKAKADLVRSFTDEKDYLPGLSREQKEELLSNISYYDYLKDYVKVDQQVLEVYRRWGMSYWCVGIDEVPAIHIPSYDDGGGMPGLRYTMPRVGHRGDEPYIFHFPDGNASVARLLVRALLPQVIPGSTMEDVVTAKADYSKLDRKGQDLAIRLNSTAVNVQHRKSGERVDTTYVRDGRAHTVTSKHCIMACYNSAIPYLCPELPKAQVEGLKYNVKVPLVYTKVVLNNWRPFASLGASYVYFTNDFYKQIEFGYPVSMGGYNYGDTPDKPMTLHLCHVPHYPDIKGPAQWRAGRSSLLNTPFSKYEHHAIDQIQQAVGDHGFDAARDVAGITVNRWSHGYAYNPGLLWEPDWPDEASKPWVIGRQRFGHIGIANSDAGASADTDTAIYQGHRAVADLLNPQDSD
ncbi:MAG: FAD-dependent oxidoreductase [Gammaproteobacteria bacterium]